MSEPSPVKPKIGILRLFRNIWGVLFLLTCVSLLYGADQSSLLLCRGAMALVFIILYARNGSAIRREQQHAEMLEAIRQGKNIDL